MSHPETLLLAIHGDGTMRISQPPKPNLGNFKDRALIIGKLENAKHVICSPNGELFCVHGDALYRGPMPSEKDVNWFSLARRVGKLEWNKFKIIFFHPNGELYGTTYNGEFHKGPQPDNENVAWMYEQATKIGTKNWDQCEALFFDPSGVLHAVIKEDRIVKSPPPTRHDFLEWLKTSKGLGANGWLKLTHFMSFSPDGKLWSIEKENGVIYRGVIPDDGRYVANAECLGHAFNQFPFLAFTKDKTICNIISFQFLPEKGKRSSENLEVIEERVYDNRKSTSTLKHTFTFDKTVTSSSSFSQEHGFTIEDGASLTFKAGIPSIAEIEASVHINMSTTQNWSFTETNETQVKFSSSSEVEVPPGKAIRVVASVVKADLIVPYKARVKTLFGFETEVKGTWNGATHYNLKVTQEDYKK